MKTKEYTKAIISYYDILGFSELVNNSDAESIFTILEVFRKASTIQGEKETSIKVLSISDTIIRIIKQKEHSISSDGHSTFLQEVINTAYILHDLLSMGIVIRGSMVIDDIFVDSNCYYGPGIVNAYSIEKSAIFPRIVIDKNIIENLGIINGLTGGDVDRYYESILLSTENQINESDDIVRYFKKDDDSEYFLDYLYLLEHEYNDEFAFGKFLIKHQELISNGISKYRNTNNVLNKYLWLKKYHNKTIERFVWYENKGRDYYPNAYFFEDMGK